MVGTALVVSVLSSAPTAVANSEPGGHDAPVSVSGSEAESPPISKGGRAWAKIATGAHHTCAVRTDRSLWCWGWNANGQLGLGDRANRLVPTRVGTDQNWAHVALGAYHTCAVRTDRSLWCWAENFAGQLGLGDTTDRLVPSRV